MENKAFSHYTIIRKLGAGGMASVYLAQDNELPRQVALKLLPQQYVTDKQLTERFFREARAAASLEHPNIILIYEASVHDGQPFIAMQYINGPTIQELITAQGKMDVEEASLIICKVLETLETAHQKGIFHRDIKPSNVMLKDGKYVRVIDFGIAKAQTDPNLTQAGTAFGTPAYMAPEQFTANPDANNALFDVYAVGVTFYYMLCGKLPFQGDDPYTIRDAKMSKRPADPSKMGSKVPATLDEVIHKSLATDPKDRFQSAKEMMLAVKSALSTTRPIEIEEGEDIEVTRVISADEKPAQKTKAKSKLPLAIAAALVVLVGGYFGIKTFMQNGENDNFDKPASDPISVSSSTKLAAPFLLAPRDGVEITNSNRPEFVWNSSAGESGTYTLEYSSRQDFTSATINADLQDTTFQTQTSLANGTYYWRVMASNDSAEPSDYALASSFTIEYTPPVKPPTNGSLAVTVNENSSIFIDGKLAKANTKSWEEDLSPGQHKIRVENESSVEKKFEETVNIAEGGKVSKNYSFTISSSTAEIRVITPPYTSQIYVNDKLQQDKNTPNTLNLKPGNYDIKVKRIDTGEEMNRFVSVTKQAIYHVFFDFSADTSSISSE